MICLIGGPARTGKSHLAERARKHIDGQVLSGDAVVAALKSVLKSEWSPDLFEHKAHPLEQIHTASEKVDRLRRRDKVAWQFYEEYLRTAIGDASHDDVLIEGNLWPDFISNLGLPHKAVFLIDTSPEQVGRLIEIRDSNGDNDWMKHFSDEELAEWAKFNALRS